MIPVPHGQGKANILIVGGGGIGAITALNLTVGGTATVTLVLRSNYDIVQKRGYRIDSVDHGRLEGWRPRYMLSAVPNVSEAEAQAFDYIVCTTKMIQEARPSIAELIRSAVTPGRTTIVLVQNGLNIEAPHFELFPDNVVLSGISWMGSCEREKGIVVQDYTDKLLLGPFRNMKLEPEWEAEVAKDFMERYRAGGKAEVVFDHDVGRTRWDKLLYNATVNPLCAILEMSVGDLGGSGVAETIIRPAVLELVSIAGSLGIEIEDDKVEATLQAVMAGGNFEPSMLADRKKASQRMCRLV